MGSVELAFVDVVRAKGRVYHYYRRGKVRHRLPGNPGTREFNRAYEEIHGGYEARQKLLREGDSILPGSLAAVIRDYRKSPKWGELKPSTQVDYEKALRPLAAEYGELPVATLPRQFVFALRDSYAYKDGKNPSDPPIPTPRRANRMVTVLSILLSYAKNRGLCAENQALRPERLKTQRGAYRAWTDEELETFLAAPTTPAQLRLAAVLGFGTGQRGGDLIAMTWAAYDGSAIEVIQQKTEAKVWIPVHGRTKEALDAAPRTAVTILTRPDGRPWQIDHFRHAMGDAIKAAGLKGCVMHGLRATAATWLAEAGCSEREIMAITGHTTTAMVSTYVRMAEQKVRAQGAVAKLEAHRKNGRRTESAKPISA